MKLPLIYLICPQPECSDKQYISAIETCLAFGIRLFQLRFKQSQTTDIYARYSDLIADILLRCSRYHAKLLLNGDIDGVEKYGANGVHISGKQLFSLRRRPLNGDYLVAASCHNDSELQHACKIGLDFVVLSPVNPTTSHANAVSMGWKKFREFVKKVDIPVYALGGMNPDDIKTACLNGGQGISVLSGIWNGNSIDQSLYRYFHG